MRHFQVSFSPGILYFIAWSKPLKSRLNPLDLFLCHTVVFEVFELLSRELSCEVFPLPLGRNEVACMASHY